MNENHRQLFEALSKIAKIASAVTDRGLPPEDEQDHGNTPHNGELVCIPKSLPKRLLVTAAETARKINPVNAPAFVLIAEVAADLRLDPLRIAVLTSKYWGPTPRRLTVSFMESTQPNLRARIIGHMNAWTKTGCISFVETQGTGDVRISRGSGGYWSYLGTDIMHIPKNRQTMNLEGFTMSTDEGEYKRVIRHETGHTLGFPHEHMRKELVARIDPEKAYDYFWRCCGWPKKTVDEQVLTPLDESSIIGTPPDQTSIMCYQLPGSITVDGQPLTGGVDINQTDYTFAGKIYPKPEGFERDFVLRQGEEWEESEDVKVAV